MGTAKRTTLKILAYVGWGVTTIILAAIFLEADIVLDRSFFFGRLFALVALTSSVITLGLWFEKSRTRNVIPVEEAYRLGVEFGMKWGARAQGSADLERFEKFMSRPTSVNGQIDSPRINWPRR